MKNNKNRVRDREKSNPELRKMKPGENEDAGMVKGRNTGTHFGRHEKGKGR